MNTYHIQFNGRTTGAIGRCYGNYRIVDAPDKDAAILKLYDDFEHITNIRFLKQSNEQEATE